jgi:hypothetical protein
MPESSGKELPSNRTVRLWKGVWQVMRAVYLVVVVALVLVLATLEIIAERSVSAAYPEYSQPSPNVYPNDIYYK